MAVDEALLRTVTRPLLRLYCWNRPAVSFGYFQKYPVELADRYALVRRPTGGGIVYHDTDTTYTVVVPAGHPLHRLKTHAAYCALHRAVAAALQLPTSISQLPATPRGQYECFQNPVTGDVVAGDRKLAGGAQRRNKAGMLHQGSIAGRVSADRLVQGFRQVFAVEFAPYELSPAERALAEKLAAEKYGTADWNQRVC
jgi:lipoate-protein ligase A